MYLMYFWCISNVCSSPYLYHIVFHYTRYRYGTKLYYWYQSIRPLLTMSLRGLLLGVGDGGREGQVQVFFFSQKIAQVLVKWSQRAHSPPHPMSLHGYRAAKYRESIKSYFLYMPVTNKTSGRSISQHKEVIKEQPSYRNLSATGTRVPWCTCPVASSRKDCSAIGNLYY